jgi:hypothetical protein
MSEEAIVPGTILEWDGFVDSNGQKVSKLFVVVGCHADKNYLTIRATSQKHGKQYQPADGADYYYIPGGKLEWFDKDTWVLFSAPQEFNRVGLDREKKSGKLRVLGCLRFQMANEICNKMRKCDDVSEHYVSLLGPTLSAPANKAG